MGIIDAIFLNSTNAVKGFDVIRGKQKYTIAYTKNDNVLCWFYDMDGLGKKIIEVYCDHNNLDRENIIIKIKYLKNKSEEVKDMIVKKICLLDKKLVTYEYVVNLSQIKNIKGFKQGTPKNTLNKFELLD